MTKRPTTIQLPFWSCFVPLSYPPSCLHSNYPGLAILSMWQACSCPSSLSAWCSPFTYLHGSFPHLQLTRAQMPPLGMNSTCLIQNHNMPSTPNPPTLLYSTPKPPTLLYLSFFCPEHRSLSDTLYNVFIMSIIFCLFLP